ncbi:hypothetical protein PS6_009993 [Mucor atramentarius]
MSPSIIKSGEVPTDSDFDLQKWLKEIEGAENLMSEVESKADTLQAKPVASEEKEDTIMVESEAAINQDKDEKVINEEPEKKQ